MAKRFYLCDIIGDGSIENPYRAAVADLGVNHVSVFPPQDPNTGQYTRPHCLVLVNASNHSALRADKRLDALPDFPLDGKVDAIENTAKVGMRNVLGKRGFSREHATNKDGYREVIRSIGRELDPGFDENDLDASE
jgi:hypothetical protein